MQDFDRGTHIGQKCLGENIRSWNVEHPNGILEIALHTYHYCILFSTHTPINDAWARMSAIIAFYCAAKAATICSAQHENGSPALSYRRLCAMLSRIVVFHCSFGIIVPRCVGFGIRPAPLPSAAQTANCAHI